MKMNAVRGQQTPLEGVAGVLTKIKSPTLADKITSNKRVPPSIKFAPEKREGKANARRSCVITLLNARFYRPYARNENCFLRHQLMYVFRVIRSQ